MSVDAYLDIKLGEACQPLKLIEELRNNGWSYDDHGHISYIPLHDNGDFDWQTERLDRWKSVATVIQEKQDSNELIAIALTWKDTQVGGNFHFDEGYETLFISLSIDRQTIKDSMHTDFSWYTPKIVTLISDLGYCNGLIPPDTLIRDNKGQPLRCQYESETQLQTIPEGVQGRSCSAGA